MAKLKKKMEAECSIDVRDLTDEDVRILKEFADFLRQKTRKVKTGRSKEDISFASWPLGVKDSLTRRDIYDHL